MARPTSSIIIPTYNRANSLMQTLQSLSNQSFPSELYEIIIVDDGSDDSTINTYKEIQKTNLNLKIIQMNRNSGPASARNIGIKNSRGNFLIFTDDDCIADKFWIENMTTTLVKHHIVAGAIDSKTDNTLKLSHNISLFNPFMPGNNSLEKDFIAGANMGFQQPVLKELNGFENGRYLAEDMELITRARMKGYKVFFEPKAIIEHRPTIKRITDTFLHSFQHAKETILLRNYYQAFLKTPSVLRSPFLILLVSPLIALKAVMGIYLGNANLLRHPVTIPFVFCLKIAWCCGAFHGLRKRICGQGNKYV